MARDESHTKFNRRKFLAGVAVAGAAASAPSGVKAATSADSPAALPRPSALRPTAAIALAKHAHRNLRDRDPNTTSVVRFIGAWFICVAVLLLVGFMMSPT